MNKNTIIIVLAIVLIVLGGFTYYLYSGVTKCKAIATDLGTQLQTCGAGITTYQNTLTALMQIPACAAYLPAQ